jgi:signal transduction histidine kinase
LQADSLPGPEALLPPPWDGRIVADEAYLESLRELSLEQPTLALNVSREVLRQAQLEGSERGIIIALMGMTITEAELGIASHMSWCAEALQRAERIDDEVLSLHLLRMNAAYAYYQGRHVEGLELSQQGIDRSMAAAQQDLVVKFLQAAAANLNNMGQYMLATRMHSRSRRLLATTKDAAAEDQRRLHDNNEANSYLLWARTLTEDAQAGERRAALQRALQLVESGFGDSPQTLSVFWQVNLLDTAVATLLELDRPEDARRRVEEVLRNCGDDIEHGGYFWACVQMSLAEIELEDGSEPATTLQRLQSVEAVEHADLQTGPARLRLLTMLAQASERAGDVASALRYHKQWAQRELASRSRLAAERVEALERNQSALRGEAMEFILHDLRSPLASALAVLEAGMAGTVGMMPREASALPQTAQAIRKSLRVADSALGIMRAEYLVASELNVLDLGELVDEVCEERIASVATGRRLQRSIAHGLMVVGDAALLRRAVDNIVDNALQHTPSSGYVIVSVSQNVDEIVLTVDDQGPGVPKDVRRALFRRYAAGRGSEGHGLGLALVSRVARLHDARIEVDSREGAGTSFKLLFPANDERMGEPKG